MAMSLNADFDVDNTCCAPIDHAISSDESDSEENQDEVSDSLGIVECLEMQLMEVEMLQAMFFNPGEFRMDDKNCLSAIQKCVDGLYDHNELTLRVGFTLKFQQNRNPLEIVCQLPHRYPSGYPVVFARSAGFSREGHSRFNQALQDYIQQQQLGEMMLLVIVEWIRDHLDEYVEEVTPEAEGPKITVGVLEKGQFFRWWLYSHHIYSKFKRRDILAWASELQLTGFSLPGKPGMICIEGHETLVEEFWSRIRRLTWKKLMIKGREWKDVSREHTVDSYRKFTSFEEKAFNATMGKGREYHMDLGMLFKYLQATDCAYVFPLYFGVDGKTTAD